MKCNYLWLTAAWSSSSRVNRWGRCLCNSHQPTPELLCTPAALVSHCDLCFLEERRPEGAQCLKLTDVSYHPLHQEWDSLKGLLCQWYSLGEIYNLRQLSRRLKDRFARPLPGRITAPDVSNSWLTSDISLGKLLSEGELDTEVGLMAVPLAALGLCNSSTLCLRCLLSMLMSSSRCPVQTVINSELKSDWLSKYYKISINCTKIQYNQWKFGVSLHLSVFILKQNTSWNKFTRLLVMT